MKNLLITMTIISLATFNVFAYEQKSFFNNSAANTMQLFTAEDKSTGKYWSGDKNSGTARIGEDEYINVRAIKKNQLNTKLNKRLKKGKNYLGFYFDEQLKEEFYLYGNLKNPAPVDDKPDSDVLTVKAIIADYGDGE